MAFIITSAVIGAFGQGYAADSAASASRDATARSAEAAAGQLDFAKKQYADQKPLIDKLGLQSVASNDLAQSIARDQAARSATAWNQNQSATQGSVGQMGLNALGAQYLTKSQIKQLIAFQVQAASNDPDTKAVAQARIANLQKTAETNAIGLEGAKADAVTGTAAAQGGQVQGAYGANADTTKAIGSTLASGLVNNASNFSAQEIGLGDADAKAAIDDANNIGGQVQTIAKQRAADNELRGTTQANAAISTSADEANRHLLRLGGDPNRLASMSADISNRQQLARIAAGNEVANTNISNLNAADSTVLGLKSSALDAARKSHMQTRQAALGMNMDAAGGALSATTGAAKSAADTTLAGTVAGQGLTFAGQNAGVNIRNSAKDKVDAGLNSLQQGTANFGAGFANTSGQNAQGAVTATTAGVNNLNTGVNAPVPLANLVNNAHAGTYTAGNQAIQGTYASLNAASSGAKALGDIAGAASRIPGLSDSVKSFFTPATAPAPDAYDGSNIISSKKKKRDIARFNPDKAMEGLETASPKTYRYKPGEGPPGPKIGAMAEDLHEQFGDRIAPGGKVVSMQNMVGLQHAALVGLSKRIKKLEARSD